MKNFFKELFRVLNNDIWYLLLPRCLVLLFFGAMIFLRPAASLRICSWLLLFLSGILSLYIFQNSSSPARHLAWGLPLAALCVLLIPQNKDAAGILFSVGICVITALRARSRNTPSARITAWAASAAALILTFKSFSAVWFDICPAVSLTFFAAAAWESGNLKFIRQPKFSTVLPRIKSCLFQK